MGKRSKAKKQQMHVDEEPQEEPVEEELDFEKEDAGQISATEEPLQEDTEVDSKEFDFEKDDAGEKPEIKKTTLIIGLIFATLGLLGIAGLRSGIIQTMLGYTASPGIGSEESMALLGSLAPLTIGLFMIGFWGVKNDPIYNKIEKAKKGSDSSEVEDIPENLSESDEEDDTEEESEIIRKEPAKAEAKSKEIEPEEEIVGEITQDSVPDEFNESLEDLEDELNEVFDEPAPLPKVDPEALKKQQEQEDLARIQKCEKMLNAAVVLPDDKKHLKGLIAEGISTQEFTEELKEAVQKRKKKEEEKNVTAEEKASILEDELVAELGELGDDDDESSLEDDIIKELEDLDGL
jgi:hypothetical protein